MTLTEFLLARIAEDERYATDERRNVERMNDPMDAAMGERRPDWHWNRSTRIVAECEAKRRLIALHEDFQWNADPDPDEPGERPFGCYACHGPCGILTALALPYADHPDYQEAWRP